MTTQAWSTRARHDSDSLWQEWRDELITKLAALVTSGDLAANETNITPGSGARAGTNSEAGYAVYHLADALHGSAPIYIRFGFGTGNSTSAPRIQMTVGTSTNGSGVLGGTALTTIHSTGNTSTSQAVDTARNSYLCATEGFFGLNWKMGSGGSEPNCFMAICRTCDGAGDPTATGAFVVWGAAQTGAFTATQALRFAATAAAYTERSSPTETCLGINPQARTSTQVGSDIQIFIGWMPTPQVAPIFGLPGALEAEVTAGNSFSIALVGATPRTYLALNSLCGPFGPGAVGAGNPKMCMLYE